VLEDVGGAAGRMRRGQQHYAAKLADGHPTIHLGQLPPEPT
jgi:hypothetical protein